MNSTQYNTLHSYTQEIVGLFFILKSYVAATYISFDSEFSEIVENRGNIYLLKIKKFKLFFTF